MKKLLVGILTVVLMLSPARLAAAHVLITDTTKTKGAVLHIDPDDDPVAGLPSTLYLDAQTRLLASKDAAGLLVARPDGQTDLVAAQISGSLAVFSYTFPAQGVYRLTFTVSSASGNYTFAESQRVSRGFAASALDKPDYGWADTLLLASGVGFALLAIVAFNRRKDIAAQSKF